MEKKTKKTYINKRFKEINIEEYDYHDIINYDNAIGDRKIPYLENVLKKKLTHITFSTNTHPKSRIIKGMAVIIFFEYIKIIVEELFNSNKVKINYVGTIELRTKESTTTYKGFIQDRKRSKNKGIYTVIECTYDKKMRNLKYKRPFWAFGLHYKNKIRKIEDTGFKY